jgi:hypothetical protein
MLWVPYVVPIGPGIRLVEYARTAGISPTRMAALNPNLAALLFFTLCPVSH